MQSPGELSLRPHNYYRTTNREQFSSMGSKKKTIWIILNWGVHPVRRCLSTIITQPLIENNYEFQFIWNTNIVKRGIRQVIRCFALTTTPYPLSSCNDVGRTIPKRPNNTSEIPIIYWLVHQVSSCIVLTTTTHPLSICNVVRQKCRIKQSNPAAWPLTTLILIHWSGKSLPPIPRTPSTLRFRAHIQCWSTHNNQYFLHAYCKLNQSHIGPT